MRRISKRLASFVVGCLFVTVRAYTGKTLPPQNVSLRWRSDLEIEAFWAPPQHSVENCTYEVNVESNNAHNSRTISDIKESSWSDYYVMEGGFLNFSVQTVCNGSKSEAVVVNITYPELVKNLECYSTSSKQAECSWEAANDTNVRFYYRYWEPHPSSVSISDQIKECPSYRNTEDMKTVCHLQPVDMLKKMDIVLNGTLDNVLVMNTYEKSPSYDVRLPPLEWNVTKTGNKLYITWNPPDFNQMRWKYIINYTECGEQKVKEIRDTSTHLDLVSHCPYRMTIKAECSEMCASKVVKMPWSKEKYFDADINTDALMYTAIIVPLMFAGLAGLAFVYCRKNKEKVFPKVPQPRDLLSEISDNNNKISVRNLYIPTNEEENCKIALVIDPQTRKPNC